MFLTNLFALAGSQKSGKPKAVSIHTETRQDCMPGHQAPEEKQHDDELELSSEGQSILTKFAQANKNIVELESRPR